MTFFLDNCVPIGLAQILKIAQCDVVHFQEVWPDSQFPDGVDDVDWIPEIGRRGWIIVSADPKITTRPPEVAALKKAHVVAFFIYKGFTEKLIFEQARWLFRSWERIEHEAHGASKGNYFEVRSDGAVKVLHLRNVK